MNNSIVFLGDSLTERGNWQELFSLQMKGQNRVQALGLFNDKLFACQFFEFGCTFQRSPDQSRYGVFARLLDCDLRKPANQVPAFSSRNAFFIGATLFSSL